jgi:hypothetical protein
MAGCFQMNLADRKVAVIPSEVFANSFNKNDF